MISTAQLRSLARARLADARVLLDGGRYDGAVYLCGYAVEMALKARICRTLKWAEYPSTRAEFQNLASFRTHNLNVLLSLTGREAAVKAAHLAPWVAVARWDPEIRYRPVGSASAAEALDLIEATAVLLGVL